MLKLFIYGGPKKSYGKKITIKQFTQKIFDENIDVIMKKIALTVLDISRFSIYLQDKYSKNLFHSEQLTFTFIDVRYDYVPCDFDTLMKNLEVDSGTQFWVNLKRN